MIIANIPGKPNSWKRPKHNRARILFNANKVATAAFRQQLREFRPDELWDGPVQVHLIFFFERPATHFLGGVLSAEAPGWCTNPCDVDNLAKFVMDALQTVLFVNDKQVTTLKAEKMWAATGEGARTEVVAYQV